MRKTACGALLLLGAWALSTTGARADDFGFGVSITNEGRKNFFLAASTHFKVPGTTVGLCVKKGIRDEEFPVVCYLATRARVKPEALVKLRLEGKSWAQITIGLGLGAEIYHVPIKVAARPPYGNAYGHFKKCPRNAWNKLVLPDADIINLVNLRFASAHYGLAPEKVIELRAGGKDFLAVHAVGKQHQVEKALKGQGEKHRERVKTRARKGHRGSGGDGSGKGEGEGSGKGGGKGGGGGGRGGKGKK
jgi:uncharacterized membrane protein YgcG